jgi:hypothetical protein
MDLKKLGDKAKDLVDKRGGTENLKEDATELKGIATGKGSLADKAKAAVAAIKEPGGDDTAQPAPTTEPSPSAGATDAEPGAGKGERERGRRRGQGQGGHGRGRHGRGRGRGGDGDPAV